MSVSHPDKLSYTVDDQPLSAAYDEQADILYLWVGKKPSEAISITSDEGHLIRLDPETHEVVGFTIFDFCRRWQEDDPSGQFEVTVPSLGEGEGEVTASKRLEVLAV